LLKRDRRGGGYVGGKGARWGGGPSWDHSAANAKSLMRTQKKKNHVCGGGKGGRLSWKVKEKGVWVGNLGQW